MKLTPSARFEVGETSDLDSISFTANRTSFAELEEGGGEVAESSSFILFFELDLVTVGGGFCLNSHTIPYVPSPSFLTRL